jgi:hypothetical protein
MAGAPVDEHLVKLFVDQDRVDTERLANALVGKVGIDSRSGGLVLDVGFGQLKNDAKVLTLLLGRLAAHLAGVQPDDRLPVKALVELSGLPRGSVAPAVRRLYEARVVGQSVDKQYFVPRSQVIRALEFVRGSE